MPGVKEKTLGKVRFFTYFLHFPKDRDVWVDQKPFVHDLQFELKNTTWFKNKPDVYRDLLVKGEAQFKDHNGVLHRIVIEDIERPRVWGTKTKR